MTELTTMFPFLAGLVENAIVTSADIDSTTREMTLNVKFSSNCAYTILQDRIKQEYALRSCRIIPEFAKTEGNSKEGKIIYGTAQKSNKLMEMSEVTLETGRCLVEGDVIAVSSREIQKRGAAVLTFDITDYTNSVRVSKFLDRDEDKKIIEKIKIGDHLRVWGFTTYSKFENDLVIEPKCISTAEKQVRRDDAEVKRVELHMHTRFSALDALTDPAAIVKRASQWGMPAIAVTDHGVAQAFPDMWKAGKKYGVKIIYGLECYFVNDMEGGRSVTGRSKLPLDGEFIAFDLETTGLDPRNCRIIEIGAVLFQGGEIKDTFDIFVDPEVHIPPEITKLTGITDNDVDGAMKEEEAVTKFLEFAKDLPLIAHNASFDTSFIHAVCERHAIRYTPVVIDTLSMSKALLPDLTRFKLDTVSDALALPKFNHHRAYDDAAVVARIMGKFIPMMKGKGAKTVDDINGVCSLRGRADADKSHHMILLVKNKKGLKNLYEIISQSFLNFYSSRHRTPIVPKSILNRYREGLIVGSACGQGELYSAILKGASDEEIENIASYYDYLEIQPLPNNGFLIDEGRIENYGILEGYNKKIYDLGHKLGKPVAAASDVHFLDPHDEEYRHILQAVHYGDGDRSCPIYFRTTNEMLEEFKYLGDEAAKEVVIDVPRAIAEEVDEIELLPKDLFPPKIENSAEDLKNLVYGKMHRIYGENPPEIIKSRVDEELNTILDHHYDVIYMSAQKLVQNSLEHGYLVGSRGSVGSSLVAFMSGITEVNALPAHYVCPKCHYTEFAEKGTYGCGADMPEKKCPVCGEELYRDGFDIPFETFLGFPGNEKTPDIDLNFSGEYQSQAHKYTETLFGSDHVFRAGTIGTLADKTAYGYVSKYLEERGKTVSAAEKNRLALGLVGIKRTTSQHPGGLVIIPQDMDVTDFCPVQHPAEDMNSDIITTHFEYHCMEDNLLKLDELGHDDPTMIRMLEDMTGVDAKKISLSDPDTMSIFTSPAILGLPDDDPIIGKTGSIGVPEFGTPFTRGMLVETQPTQFDTLVRLSGFSHGTDVWAGNIRDLITGGIATVNETVGCRDDIMITLISKGMEAKLAFKTMEQVRKGKVKASGEFPGDAEKQMKDLGIPDWWIESCRKIAYLFPKAHAVAYVMMAFRIAWFKVHEPLAFYSAYFYRRSQKGEFDAEMMTGGTDSVRKKIQEYKKRENLTANEESMLVTLEAVYEFNMRGFEFATMDISKADATKFLITDDKKLMPPFVSVPGLGESAALDLIACRGREFVSISEIAAVCPKVSQTNFQALKNLGALGDLPESSQINLFEDFNL